MSQSEIERLWRVYMYSKHPLVGDASVVTVLRDARCYLDYWPNWKVVPSFEKGVTRGRLRLR